MSIRTAGICVALALAGAATEWAAAAPGAELGLPLGNGDKVRGTLDGPGNVEAFQVRVPAQAKLIVSVKGVRSKDAPDIPVMTLGVRDPTGTDVAAGVLRPKGRTGAKTTLLIEQSGSYHVEVSGDAAGDYLLSVKWKGRTKFVVTGPLPAPGEGGLELAFAVEPGSAITAQAKAGKRSAALPRLETVTTGLDVLPIDAPADAGAKKHKVKKLALRADSFGDSVVSIVNATGGAAGEVACKLVVHPPKASRRNVGLTDRDLGAGGDVVEGDVFTSEGGALDVPIDDPGGLGGAMLEIPPNALDRPTVCFIGDAPPLDVEGELEGAGPTVTFGPAGLKFKVPALLTIPFDPAAFPEGTDELRVFVRDHKGRVSEVPRDGAFVVNPGDGTVSFQRSAFSAYRVYGPGLPSSTLHAVIDGANYDVSYRPGDGGTDYYWHRWNNGNLTAQPSDEVPYAPLPGATLETSFNFQFEIAGQPIVPLPRRWDEPVINLLITQMIMDADNNVVDTLGWDTGGQPFELTVTSWDGVTMGGTFSGMARPHFGGGAAVPISGSFSFIVPR